MKNAPRVLALIGEKDGHFNGCDVWRVLQPFTELTRQGYKGVGWDMMENPMVSRFVHMYEAIVIPRRHWIPADWKKGQKWIDAMHKAGIAVIYEVDDDLFSHSFSQRLIDVHGKPKREASMIRKSARHTVQIADGVTVSSQRLATIVSGITDKPVKVVPNYIDLQWFRGVQATAERGTKELTIGWAGGIRPDKDVTDMAIAWGRIAEKFPDVKFVVMGHQAPIIYEHVPVDRIVAIDWMAVEDYPAGMVEIDIGCCPLSDSPFNRAKTYIKAMEYAATGAAVVASPTVYNQFIDDGNDGYICRSADEWETTLTELISDESHRRGMAQRLLDKVESQHSLEGNAWRWLVAWQDIIDDFRRRRQATQILTPSQVGVWA